MAAKFPNAIAGDADVLVAANRAQTTLLSAMGINDTTAALTSGASFPTNSLFMVDSEICLITANGGTNNPTVQRGYDGTTPAAHSQNALVSGFIMAHHHNQLAQEVEAIETALGAQLTNVPATVGVVAAPTYNFTPLQPGGSLAIGSNTITLNPMPAGITAESVTLGALLYISGGTGTAEVAPITGVTATTVTVTCANTHSGAWTVQSASAGIQEAVVAVNARGGGDVYIPAGTYTMRGTVYVPSHVHIRGDGYWCTVLQRTADYGDTFVLGTSGVGAVLNVWITGLKVSHTINYNGSTISNKPTVFPNCAHVRAYGPNNCRIWQNRFENLPYGLVVNGGAYSIFEQNDFQSLWDYANASLQVGFASIQVNNTATQAYPSGHKFHKNTFFGYLSNSRTVAVNGNNHSFTENVGPKYGLEVTGCEVIFITENFFSGADYYSLFVHPINGTCSGGVVDSNHFDGDRLSNIAVDNEGSVSNYATDWLISNNDNLGASTGLNNIIAPDTGVGLLSFAGLVCVGNKFNYALGSSMVIENGNGFLCLGNSIRNYNCLNDWPSTARQNSAIYFGGRANKFFFGPNSYGGGNAFENSGAGNTCVNAVTVSNTGQTFGHAVGFNAGISGQAMDRAFCAGPTWRFRSSGADENLKLTGEVGIAGAVALSGLNDAEGANIPGEFRFSKACFPLGPLQAPGLNYISNETGANNAIAGSITGIPLTAGMTVVVRLAHSLQSGANTFNYNGGGAVAIKKSSNPANDLGTAYVAGSMVTLGYDGTVWQDMRQ